MKKTLYLVLTALSITLIFAPNTLAQDSPQWHLPDGAKMRLGKGEANEIAYSPDGTKLAVASAIGIWIYDAQTGEELNLITGKISSNTSIGFTLDGNLLVNDIGNRNLSLWDMNTGMHRHTFPLHNYYNTKVSAFSPDGKLLASLFPGPVIRLWDTESGMEIYPIARVSGFPHAITFSTDGRTLAGVFAGGFGENYLFLWDVDTGHVLHLIEHTDRFNCLAFSPDGKMIATGSADRSVRLWDVESGVELQSKRRHKDAVNKLAFSPDGKTLASSSMDNVIRIWRVLERLERHEITSLTNNINHLTFSPDSQTLVSASWDGTIHLWDVFSGKQKFTINGHVNPIESVAFSHDGNKLVSGGQDEVMCLWDANTGIERHNLSAHTDYINSVAFSPEGYTIASGSEDGTMRLWDAHTGREKHTLIDVHGVVKSVAFSSDRKTVAGATIHQKPNRPSAYSRTSNISLFDVETGTALRTITAYNAPAPPGGNPDMHSSPVRSIAFSPNGNMLATGSYDKTIRLWNVQTGTHLRLLAERVGTVKSLSFSSDGITLAGVNYSGDIYLWNVASGAQSTPTAVSAECVAFSPDGTTLAIGGWNGTVHLWDVDSSMELHTFAGHHKSVYSIAFSADGSTLASGSSDGTVLLWDLTPRMPTNTTVSLSPMSVESPIVGEQLTLSINIGGGQNVAGYQATVHFDPATLRYVESRNGDYLPDTAYVIPTVVDGDRIMLAATSFGEESHNDGALATITFAVVATKASTVSLSDVLLTDSVGNSTKPKIIASTEITEPMFLPEDVNEDDVVNILDLVFIAGNFGKTGKNAADVNRDGVVNIVDLTLVAAAIGDADYAAPVLQFQNQAATFTRGIRFRDQEIAPTRGIRYRDQELTPTRTDVTAWLKEARSLNLSDPDFQRGILVLESLLKAFTPKETALLPNYPNPFNPETWIPYQLATPADVSISIYTADGKLIRQLNLGHLPVGIYQHRSRAAHWDGKNAQGEPVASGVYFYTFSAEQFTATRKMLIRK